MLSTMPIFFPQPSLNIHPIPLRSFPCEPNLLKKYCVKINHQMGYESKYKQLLDLMHKAIEANSTQSNRSANVIQDLYTNFISIRNCIPQPVTPYLELIFNKFFSFLFLKKTNLETECQKINNHPQDCEDRYLELLNHVQGAFHPYLSEQDCFDLYNKLMLICQFMPNEIKNKARISKILKTLSLSLNPIRLNEIKDELEKNWNPADLRKLYEEFDSIKQLIPQTFKLKFKDIIDKCEAIYMRRVDIVNFASQHVIVDSRPRRQRSIYPILSIDGGGIRGIIPATLLIEVEKITRKPIAHLFKLIGGTSTGGILALGLTRPHEDDPERPQCTAQDLLNLYTQKSQSIFHSNPAYQNPMDSTMDLRQKIRWKLDHPKYSCPSSFFKQKFGRATLSSALTDVLITANTTEQILSKICSVGLDTVSGWVNLIARIISNSSYSKFSHDYIPKEIDIFTKYGLKTVSYSLKNLEESYKFPRSYIDPLKLFSLSLKNDRNYRMEFVARVTSAAPTFFPYISGNNEELWDGGILQNNPTLPCILKAVKENYALNDLFVVSLGTGKTQTSPNDFSQLGFHLWCDMTQPDMQTERVVSTMLKAGAYHRFQYRFKDYAPALDAINAETIAQLQECGGSVTLFL